MNDTQTMATAPPVSARKMAFTVGSVVWIAVVFAAYYAVHKPVPGALAQAGEVWGLLQSGWSVSALGQPILDLGFALWLLFSAMGAGAWWVRAWLGKVSLQEQLVFGAALGMGALSILISVLAAAHVLSPQAVGLVLGVFTVAALFGWATLPYPEQFPRRMARAAVAGGVSGNLLKLCLVITGFCLVTKALTPPAAWDSLVYHLTLPRRTIEAGGLQGNVDAAHFYFPSLVEQLFTAEMLLRGDTAARVVHLLFAAVGSTAVFCFVRSYAGPSAALVGLVMLVSATSLLSLATQAYVEWGLLTFGFLAFWALQAALARGDRRWLLLSGCCAGLTMGVKYTGVFIVGPLAAVILWQTFRGWRAEEESSVPSWTDAACWVAVAAAVASPWYLKNLALTGNPVYPLLFGGWNWDAWKSAWITRPGTGLISEPIRVFSAPWELTVLGAEGSAFYDATVGPLFLALLPLALALPRSPWARRAAAVFGGGYALWLAGAATSALLIQGRLLLPALPFLAVVLASAVQGAARFSLPLLRLQFFVHASVALVAGLTTLSVALSWVADPPLPYLLGAESRGAFLERHLGDHYRAMTFVNTELPRDAKILLLWEPRSYFCERDCRPDTLLFNWRHLLYINETGQKVRDGLRAEGITHVLIYGGGLRFFSEPPNVEMEGPHIAVLRDFEEKHLERLYGPSLLELSVMPAEEAAGGGYAIFRLK